MRNIKRGWKVGRGSGLKSVDFCFVRDSTGDPVVVLNIGKESIELRWKKLSMKVFKNVVKGF